MTSQKETDDPNKKVWTETERLELASKLDKELEDYIDNLDKKSYSDGWPEDRWQEEMEKHPFFMTQMPENPDEMSPLIEGLQQLKYSESYNTPNELAQSYKEDGNFNYKHKKYRLAILSFTQGIATKCLNFELLSQLYSNRALAQFKLKNYRSSLNDCKQALKLNPEYLKALCTAAKCCFHTKNYDQCIMYCDQSLNLLAKDEEVDFQFVSLRAKAVKQKQIFLRDVRVKTLNEKKIDEIRDDILKVIKARKINIEDYSELFKDNNTHVHLHDENSLVWPVVFAYPEINQTDFVHSFHELTIFNEQLEELYEEPPAWDFQRRYHVQTINVYYEGIDKELYKVDKRQSLGQILQHKSFIVKNGTPWFFVLVANSKEETCFKNNYNFK